LTTDEIRVAVVTGRKAYDDPNYRMVLARGVRWAARRL
jgi:type 1 glutamine amidotransferase